MAYIQHESHHGYFIEARTGPPRPFNASICWKNLRDWADLDPAESDWYLQRYPWDRWEDSWA